MSTLTARKPEYIDSRFPEIRRGFLDVFTPVSELPALLMPLEEQRAFLLAIIKDLEQQRDALREGMTLKGGVKTYRQRKNLARKLNTNGRFRQMIRSAPKHADVDLFVDLGRRIQEVQRLMPKRGSV